MLFALAVVALAACSLFGSKAASPPSDASSGVPSSTETTTTEPLPPVGRIGPGPSGSDPSLQPIKPAVTTAPSSSAAASASAGPSVPPSTTVDVRSDCPDTLHVFLGEKPGGPGSQVDLAGRATVAEPRTADGKLTVWILDGKGKGVTTARAYPDTKRIIIAIDCRSMSIE